MVENEEEEEDTKAQMRRRRSNVRVLVLNDPPAMAPNPLL